MSNLFVEAFILGLIGGAVPGPILTGTFTEILKSGLWKGLRIVFYALIAETIGAFLAILIIYSLGLPEVVFKLIAIGGAIVLFWLAFNVWQIKEVDTEKKAILSFNKVILLTVLNSGYWIFWLTVGISKAFVFDKMVIGGKYIFLGIFELAWLIMTAALAFIFFQFRPMLHKKNLVGTTFKIFAIILVVLGTRTIIGAF